MKDQDIKDKRQEIDHLLNIYALALCLRRDLKCDHFLNGDCCSRKAHLICLKKELDSQGIVVKVDKELPNFDIHKWHGAIVHIDSPSWQNGFYIGQDSMLKAGFTATERLVE